ncbi:MAG: YqgE/AlgH family protein [Rhodobacteraceae bacterium]|nr:YqgE/AlgH family protein [Paracoccaceae bacterium]
MLRVCSPGKSGPYSAGCGGIESVRHRADPRRPRLNWERRGDEFTSRDREQLQGRPLRPHINEVQTQSDTTELSGKLLIAMPGMGDPRFEHSVVFLCDHSDKGSMGLIINKTAPELEFTKLLEQLEISSELPNDTVPVHFGGPVENGRGFVLHSPEYEGQEGSLKVGQDYGLTVTLDVVRDLATGDGPERSIFALGYSGWGPGQLDDEISQNAWLTCDATPDLVFGTANAEKWNAALKALGVDALLLSAEAGRA